MMKFSLKIKCFIKYILALICHYSGINRYIIKKNKKLFILMFHRISNDVDHLHISISAANFKKSIYALLDYGDIVSLDDVVSKWPAKSSFSLTFDDGYSDVKILPDLIPNIPVTVYASTAFFDNQESFWMIQLESLILKSTVKCIDLSEYNLGTIELKDDLQKQNALQLLNNEIKKFHPDIITSIINELISQIGAVESKNNDVFLSWSEAKHLHDNNIIIGAHTHNHKITTMISDDDLRLEIDISNKIIKDKIGKSPCHFAYPNGSADDISEASRQILIDYGYKSAVTTIEGPNIKSDDIFRLQRINITQSRITKPIGGLSIAMLTTVIANPLGIH